MDDYIDPGTVARALNCPTCRSKVYLRQSTAHMSEFGCSNGCPEFHFTRDGLIKVVELVRLALGAGSRAGSRG